MPSINNLDLSRLDRLLEACRKGLNHDLPNELVALHGLLQLLQMEEADRLSAVGRDYVRRLLGVAQRTQGLTRTLKELARLAGETPGAVVVALPQLIEEVLAEWPTPPPCTCTWDAPRVVAPPPLLQQAVAQALRLLLEFKQNEPAHIIFGSRPAPAAVELSIHMMSAAAPADVTADLPAAWHERLECVLIRELVESCAGKVQWHHIVDRLGVLFTLTAPR
jgi:light-regulated signal transduction histidine kinase (bacteriophytochrome)